MSVIILIVLFILFLGPLRRPYLKHARFTVPFTIMLPLGFGISWIATSAAGLSPTLAALVAPVMAIGLASSVGSAYKNWCDRTFGPKE